MPWLSNDYDYLYKEYAMIIFKRTGKIPEVLNYI